LSPAVKSRAFFPRATALHWSAGENSMTHQILKPRKGVELAYHRYEGASKTLPGVMFCGGFRSDMEGSKATYLEERCKARHQSYVRFDYSGHGKSNGVFEEGNISTWLADALAVFDMLTEGPQIVVGSSMGGWIALLLALARPKRMAGLVGLAPAPDFTEDIFHKEFGEEERRHLLTMGMIYLPNDYDAPYPLTRQLFEDGKKHLLLHERIHITCPVRLIHGKQDTAVPWQKSEDILRQLTSENAQVIWVEDGDHRLSTPSDLERIDNTVQELSVLHQAQRVSDV
jgi:pimeloyl-ACP methyl ester carboxylesterase